MTSSLVLLSAGGLLAGFGSRMGNGCTSGHGVCGFARLSARSITATVIFMVAAVATVNPAEKANLLSASISVAMNCTAFGLMTAVPLLFIHAWLQTKTTELIDSLEMASVKFLNAITERQQPPAAAA